MVFTADPFLVLFRFSADRLYAISNIRLGKKGSKIEVTTIMS